MPCGSRPGSGLIRMPPAFCPAAPAEFWALDSCLMPGCWGWALAGDVGAGGGCGGGTVTSGGVGSHGK